MRGERIKLKIEINLDRIRSNVLAIKRNLNVPIMLMVKADAYGFGIKEVATSVEDIVDYFGVVTLEEGVALREVGIKKPILLCDCAIDEIKRAIELNLTIALHDTSQIVALKRLIDDGALDKGNVQLHIKIDSEMHRLGFAFDEVGEVVKRLQNLRLECRKQSENLSQCDIDVTGIYTHLRDGTFNSKSRFDECVRKLKNAFPNAVCHVASSHSLGCQEYQYDLVRLGLFAYNGAMSVKSQVLQSRRVKKGERVSYGDYVADRDMNTAIVFGGYADGVSRENPSCAYIRSCPCKVLGNVCMDYFVVDTTDFIADVGEEVLLFDENIANSVIEQRKTIEYTLYTCWKGRVERIYNGQKHCTQNSERKSLEIDRRAKRLGERCNCRRIERNRAIYSRAQSVCVSRLQK